MGSSGSDADGDHRPLVHLTPESGWVNDPLALTWHGGRYHLFTQHVPGGVEWVPACHWGHAVSDDLLRWSPRPVALAPGDGDGGVWSGSIVVPRHGADEVGVQLFYTSVDTDEVEIGRIRVARPSEDAWDTWTKGDVVATLPQGVDAVAFRDPYVVHDGETWRMVVGGGTADGRAVAWTWTSPDRRTWTYSGELSSRSAAEGDPVWTGEAWECPVLFPLDDRWVLVVSVWRRSGPQWVGYGVGDLVGGRFVATTWGRLGHGESYYAASTFLDADGRRGLVHWLRGVADPAGRWAGAASIPQVVCLDGERLVARPHPAATSGPHAASSVLSGATELPAACWIDMQAEGLVDVRLVGTGGRVVVAALEIGDSLVLTAGELGASLPLGGSRWVGILVDRLVVEVFTDGGIAALPVEPAGSLRMVGGAAGAASVRAVVAGRAGALS